MTPLTTITSIAELDQVHQQLADMIAGALLAPAGAFASGFRTIVQIVETDCRREEQLMDSFQCADAALHRAQHARMQAGLHHAAAALDHGDAVPARQALEALREWLPYHIETQDRHLLCALRAQPPAA